MDENMNQGEVVLYVQPHALNNGFTPPIATAYKNRGVTSVNLSNNNIGAHAPATAARFKDTGVTSVNLSNNNIGADAPATAARFKDTGVTSVDLRNNNTTLIQDLECLDIIWDQGQIYKLGINHKLECGDLLEDHINTVLRTEFTQPFPNEIDGLIGAYANILDFDM